MKNKDHFLVERILHKEALRRGVFVKQVDMPLNHFVQMFKQRVVPYLPFKDVFKIVEQAASSCDGYYVSTDGTKYLKVQDSNMPGFVDNKFDLLNASIFEEMNRTQHLNEFQQSNIMHNLCCFIEDVAKPI